ncbi:MAG: LysM peptidoglycan-binding domain-containing protein, partial [Anaerolineae bacterium]
MLIWWILPLGLDPAKAPAPAPQNTDTPVIASVMAAAPLKESAASPAATSSAPVRPADRVLISVTPAGTDSLVQETTAAALAEATEATDDSTAETPEAPSEQPTSTPEPAATEDRSVHTVVQGDVLGRIAARYGVTLSALLEVNGLNETSVLSIGDKLVIPTPAVSLEDSPQPDATTATAVPPTTPTQAPVAASGPLLHVVAAGDTLGGLAVRYQVDSGVIATENNISVNAVLRIGQNLIIPGVSSESTPAVTPSPTATSIPTATPTATPVPSATATPVATVPAAVLPTLATGAAGLQVTPGTAVTPTSMARPSATPAPTAAPTLTPTPAPILRVHVIQAGQHIGVVAAIYDVTMAEIAAAN